MKTNKNILKNCIGAVSIIMLPALFTACSCSDEGYVGEGEKAVAPTVTASIDDDDVTMTSAIVKVEGSTKLQDLSLPAVNGYAVVLGNEVKGVRQEVVDHCDACLEIPQFGTKHSLNVSVTAGIVVWEFARRLIVK